MAGSQTHDLTDTWHGRFTYPGPREPVSFVAHLNHESDWLSGTVEEPGERRARGRTLTATISGKVTGEEVTFLKLYDVAFGGYDAVHYTGAVGDEGLEISGTWTIPSRGSGTFIMIRSRGLMLAAQRRQSVRV